MILFALPHIKVSSFISEVVKMVGQPLVTRVPASSDPAIPTDTRNPHLANQRDPHPTHQNNPRTPRPTLLHLPASAVPRGARQALWVTTLWLPNTNRQNSQSG